MAAGSGVVGDNVQVAVHIDHHLIIAHEVTDASSDRARLANIAAPAKAAAASMAARPEGLEHCIWRESRRLCFDTARRILVIWRPFCRTSTCSADLQPCWRRISPAIAG